jgi:hypothetical protein
MARQLHCEGWFRMTIPLRWQSRAESDCLSIYRDHPRSGVLQLSWYRSLLWQEDLSAQARGMLDETLSGLSARQLVFTEHRRQGVLWVSSELFVAEALGTDLCRLWCVCDASTLLLVSYLGSPAAHEEQAEIEGMVDSLQLLGD